MRIAIYWEQEEWGGVDSHLLSLLNDWPSNSDEFVVFYNKGNQGLDRIKDELNLLSNVFLKEVNSCSYNQLATRLGGSLRKLLYFIQPLLFLYMVSKLKSEFNKDKSFDVLLADNGGYPAAWGCLCSLIAAKKIGINARILLVHHEATSPGIFMSIYESLVDKIVVRSATAFVCPSQATVDSIIHKRNINSELVRMRVIYNEVSQVSLSKKIHGYTNIRELINDNSSTLIGIVGRISPYKGHEDIICAISRLDESEQNKLKLVIIGVGDTEEIDRLKWLAEKLEVINRIHFLGYVPGSPTELIKQLDLLIVATRSFEGFGLTIAEAMLASTPILTTNVGAIPEFVDSTIGTIIHPNSPKDMADELRYFLIEPDKYIIKTEKAKLHIINFTSGMTNEYRRLFIECSN